MSKQIYLVGGAVRDQMMGLKAHDHDYVVVGSSVEEMLAEGYTQVGASFPVFLHPETGDEYALARTERKNGSGYTGFEVETTGVTLKDDLARRDLTINAIAMDDADGNIHDPFNGLTDLEDKVLRHVTDAFKEDPLRILRVARFAAKLKGFTIHPDTVAMCKELGQTQEFKDISAERVGMELMKVLETSSKPSTFFYALDLFECLDVHFPEIAALRGQTQPEKWHPEGDAFVHTMEVLDRAAEGTTSVLTRYSALVHDLGKGLTPKEKLPAHHGHELAGVPVVRQMSDRLSLGTVMREFGAVAAALHGLCHNVRTLKYSTIVKIYEEWGRNVTALQQVGEVAKYDSMGRGPYNALKPYDNEGYWNDIFDVVSNMKARDVLPIIGLKEGIYTPEYIQTTLRDGRIKAVERYRKEVEAIAKSQ